MSEGKAMSEHNGAILVADDDPGIRLLIGRTLQFGGWEAVTVDDAPAAVEVLGRRGAEVRLVLLDLDLPGPSGADAVRQLRQAAPETPILAMSGHEEAKVLPESVRGEVIGFLRKPFDIKDLLAAIRRALVGC